MEPIFVNAGTVCVELSSDETLDIIMLTLPRGIRISGGTPIRRIIVN